MSKRFLDRTHETLCFAVLLDQHESTRYLGFFLLPSYRAVFVRAAKFPGLFDLVGLIPERESYLFCLKGKKMVLSKVAYEAVLAAR
jgi:hypothetical protein